LEKPTTTPPVRLKWRANVRSKGLTEFPEANFFSVPKIAPLLCAWFSAALPLITVSLCAPPAPRVLLPIFVTVSQSSIFAVVFVCVCVYV
jgi:hypothetical protein